MLKATLKQVLPHRARAQLRRLSEFACSSLEGTIVEKDIEAFEAKDSAPPAISGEFFEVSAENGRGSQLSALRRESDGSSKAKTRRYLRNGFRGVAVEREGRAVGAVWCVTRSDSKLGWVHDDLRLLRVGLSDAEAYMFDMYIEPEHRGLALSTALFRAAFGILRSRGIVRVKGYYRVHNLPALWMHRVMGYREVGRVRVRSILGVTWSYEYTALNRQ